MMFKMTDWVTDKKRFKYGEFFVSSRYPKAFEHIIFPAAIFANIKRGVEEVLDPFAIALQKKFGKKIPVKITSGFRPATLNAATGGISTSAHLLANAADIVIDGLSSYEIGLIAADEQINYRQIVVYKKKPHCHIEWMPSFHNDVIAGRKGVAIV